MNHSYHIDLLAERTGNNKNTSSICPPIHPSGIYLHFWYAREVGECTEYVSNFVAGFFFFLACLRSSLCSSGCRQAYQTTQASPKLEVLLPQSPKFWDHRNAVLKKNAFCLQVCLVIPEILNNSGVSSLALSFSCSHVLNFKLCFYF